MKSVYIYALICPLTNKPRYVGKTVNPKARMCSHLSPTSRCRKTKAWVQSLLRQGVQPTMEVLDETTEEGWQAAETGYIRLLKACGANLTNLTMGGEAGCDRSEETRLLLSRARKPELVYQFDAQGVLLASFESSRAAAKALELIATSINRACLADLTAPNVAKIYAGFLFRRTPQIDIALVSRRHATIEVYTKGGQLLYTCNTRREASERSGVPASRISDVIKGTRKNANGYVFRRPSSSTVLLEPDRRLHVVAASTKMT